MTMSMTTKGAASPRFVSDVAAAACGHWPELLAAVGIDIPRRGKHGPCPFCGGSDRFRLDDKGGRGTWICNQCGSGDGLDLLARVTGKSTKEAAELIAPLVGLSAGGLDPVERERIHQQQQARAEQERKQDEQQRQKAARRAAAIAGDVAQGVSPYLTAKGLEWPQATINRTLIREGGENYPAGSLVIPLTNEAGELVNVQLIRADGSKRYLAGGQKAGAFHRIGGGAFVAVVEGYATGLSVHLATGATVYCAMDCGNLAAVAQIARRQHPKARILLCGDNDAHTQGNPGKTKAEQAAAAIGGLIALPPIAGDWNDHHRARGLTATKEAIMQGEITQQDQDAHQREGAPWQAEVVPLHPVRDDETEKGQDMPEGFEIRGERLYALVTLGRGEDAHSEWIPISSPVRVQAETSDEHGRGYGRLLEWQDSAGRVRRWAMPVRSLALRNGEEVFAALLDAGLPFIELGHKRKLAAYLMACQPERRITCVERTGWHGRTYVLPQGSMGPDADGVILQTAGYAANDFTERGSLSEWQQGVAGLAVGNSRLCFALSLAFAAPLLSLVGMEGGGFHLKGESTDGKTTIMKAAASVYGNPDRYSQTWRATGNSIEGLASRRNDALLCLDELGELDGREAGQVAYMLANGQGKGRSKQDGELRERKAWRLLFLSTGELSLEDHAASAGQRTQAGMEVRTIQIPSDTGHHGAFEWLHGMEGGRTFADTLKANAERQHGSAFRTYVESLTGDLEAHSERLRAEIKRIAAELTPQGAGNQVGRAINRFALVAAAGELATRLGVTGWPEGEAIRAVRVCLKAWLAERGHLGNKEDAATLAQIRAFMRAHQYTRFVDVSDPNHRPANVVGYRRNPRHGTDDELEFWVDPSGWVEITSGRDSKKAAKLSAKAGYLLGGEGRYQLLRRLPTGKRARVYVLTDLVLADDAEGQEDD
ncbi:alkaline-shock protein [Aeromonas caviae]|nr:alkaline-shock protein [Aeromonas caviae]GJA90575.1 alkaline-shock protein [Aeromonas caviae]GJB07864.1 alkaline-shock protein [Aeromonas caviae]GJB16461.1 alkaline-shock protein [Aeromonas caviae]GJB37951.1 alkaline-shock protein [Aeromonas caviae]